MQNNTPSACPVNRDGLAVIGKSLAALRGLRFAEGDGGADPKDDPKDPKAGDPKDDPKDPKDDDGPFDRDKALEKIRKSNSEAAALRKRLKDEEDKGKVNAEKGEKVTALEAENLRLRVGIKHGLPESLIKRLTGTTEEELLKDAEELMELFPGAKKPPSQQPKDKLAPGGSDPADLPAAFDPDKFAEEVFRR